MELTKAQKEHLVSSTYFLAISNISFLKSEVCFHFCHETLKNHGNVFLVGKAKDHNRLVAMQNPKYVQLLSDLQCGLDETLFLLEVQGYTEETNKLLLDLLLRIGEYSVQNEKKECLIVIDQYFEKMIKPGFCLTRFEDLFSMFLVSNVRMISVFSGYREIFFSPAGKILHKYNQGLFELVGADRERVCGVEEGAKIQIAH